METFVCVIFIILFSNLQTVRTAETRKFKNSKVVIENGKLSYYIFRFKVESNIYLTNVISRQCHNDY